MGVDKHIMGPQYWYEYPVFWYESIKFKLGF